MAEPVRTIIVGDIHGCLEELDALFQTVELRARDRVFFLGDLVDRGPDSVGVVRRVAEVVRRQPGSLCIMGNHEEKALRFRDRGRPLPEWCTQASEADWAFLDVLPPIHWVKDLGLVLVHGGLYPRLLEKHSPLVDPGRSWRSSRSQYADRLRRILRVRHINTLGEMVPLDDVKPAEHPHWTSWYTGQEGFCFFGHDPQLDPPHPLKTLHATGLDTGCCFGGRLTAAVLEPRQVPSAAVFVSVQAKARYAEPRSARME